jgi:hypothetical protein
MQDKPKLLALFENRIGIRNVKPLSIMVVATKTSPFHKASINSSSFSICPWPIPSRIGYRLNHSATSLIFSMRFVNKNLSVSLNSQESHPNQLFKTNYIRIDRISIGGGVVLDKSLAAIENCKVLGIGVAVKVNRHWLQLF